MKPQTIKTVFLGVNIALVVGIGALVCFMLFVANTDTFAGMPELIKKIPGTVEDEKGIHDAKDRSSYKTLFNDDFWVKQVEKEKPKPIDETPVVTPIPTEPKDRFLREDITVVGILYNPKGTSIVFLRPKKGGKSKEALPVLEGEELSTDILPSFPTKPGQPAMLKKVLSIKEAIFTYSGKEETLTLDLVDKADNAMKVMVGSMTLDEYNKTNPKPIGDEKKDPIVKNPDPKPEVEEYDPDKHSPLFVEAENTWYMDSVHLDYMMKNEETIKKQITLGTTEDGVEIRNLDSKSPMYRAGFRQGMVIISVNDIKVDSVDNAYKLKDHPKVKDSTELKIVYMLRGETKTIYYKLKKKTKPE